MRNFYFSGNGFVLRYTRIEAQRSYKDTCKFCGDPAGLTGNAPGWVFFELNDEDAGLFCPTHWAEFRRLFLRALLEAEI